MDQIANSLIFKGKESKDPILVIASGGNRVNQKGIKEVIDEELGRADEEFVLDATGFEVGGVAPVGDPKPIRIYIDEDIFQYDEIWAGGGIPEALLKLTPDALKDITRGKVINIK